MRGTKAKALRRKASEAGLTVYLNITIYLA